MVSKCNGFALTSCAERLVEQAQWLLSQDIILCVVVRAIDRVYHDCKHAEQLDGAENLATTARGDPQQRAKARAWLQFILDLSKVFYVAFVDLYLNMI